MSAALLRFFLYTRTVFIAAPEHTHFTQLLYHFANALRKALMLAL